jgi:hypothetical protein
MTRKIILIWIALVFLLVATQLLPHRHVPTLGIANIGLQVLLFLLCFQMARKDEKAFRPALINLTILFGSCVLLYASNFIGSTFFRSERYLSVYYHEFVNKFGYNAILSLAVVYLIVDFLAQRRSTVAKYAISICVCSVMLVPLYYPYFKDPLHLYRTEEYSRYLEAKIAHDALLKEKAAEPTKDEISQRVLKGRNAVASGVGSQDRTKEEQEIQRLSSYIGGGSELILFWKPLNLATLYMSIMLVGVLIAFYFIKFFYDHPHGAYLEKIIFFLFFFSALEGLHAWAFTKSPSAQSYYSIHSIGQYLLVAVLLALVYVCSVRLRFLISPIGTYYERQVVFRPEMISRWRDEIDRLVLKSFLQKPPFAERLGTLESDLNPQQPNKKRDA